MLLSRSPFVSLISALALAALWLLPAPAYCAEDQQATQTVAMSQAVYDGLQTAQNAIEAGRYGEAHKALKALRELSGLTSYETAQIWNLTGYAYYLQERYKGAIKAYARVLKQDNLPEGLAQSTLKTLSQLYFTVEDYPRALKAVDRLIKLVAQPSADIYLLKGQAHFQLAEYERAIAPINTAIAAYKAQGKPAQENWLLLLRVCYYELGDFNNMLQVLKTMIRLYPRERYVQTLAAVYSELGQTGKQLALTEALYESGKIDEPSQIVNLANLYLVHGLPFKAARLLEKETESGRLDSNERNLRLLSQAWYQAREDDKAIAPLARAAQLSGDGELFVRLAQSYINLEQWSQAAEAIHQGLKKGGIKRRDTAHLMLGMALFNQRKLEAARNAFVNAAGDKRSEQTARQWLSYVDSEKNRDATLDQTLPEREPAPQDDILKNL